MNAESKKLELLGYKLQSVLIRDHEWNSDRMADWNCELTGPNGKTVSVEYHTGKAHRHMGLGKRKMPLRPSMQNWAMSKPTSPEIADLVHCLLLDSSASDQRFSDWCSDLGYDTDSRKALETYLACQNAGSNLRYIGADFAELSELLQDYCS